MLRDEDHLVEINAQLFLDVEVASELRLRVQQRLAEWLGDYDVERATCWARRVITRSPSANTSTRVGQNKRDGDRLRLLERLPLLLAANPWMRSSNRADRRLRRELVGVHKSRRYNPRLISNSLRKGRPVRTPKTNKNIDQLFEEFLADQERRLATKTYAKYADMIDLFRRYLESYWPGHNDLKQNTAITEAGGNYCGTFAADDIVSGVQRPSACAIPHKVIGGSDTMKAWPSREKKLAKWLAEERTTPKTNGSESTLPKGP